VRLMNASEGAAEINPFAGEFLRNPFAMFTALCSLQVPSPLDARER
jgi:hypothetical protein